MGKTITFSVENLANEIVSSYNLWKKGFQSEEEHQGRLAAYRHLFGADFYDAAANRAIQIASSNIK